MNNVSEMFSSLFSKLKTFWVGRRFLSGFSVFSKNNLTKSSEIINLESRETLQKIIEFSLHIAKSIENPQWKRQYEKLADSADAIDAMVARSTESY